MNKAYPDTLKLRLRLIELLSFLRHIGHYSSQLRFHLVHLIRVVAMRSIHQDHHHGMERSSDRISPAVSLPVSNKGLVRPKLSNLVEDTPPSG